MEYLVDNLLVKNINIVEGSPYINTDLFYILNPNEFFVYHFLANAEKGYSPTHYKMRMAIGSKSGSAIASVVKRLKQLDLLRIEKVGGVYMWSLNEAYARITPELKKQKEEGFFTNNERLDMEREIKRLENQLGNPHLDVNIQEALMDEILTLKVKLRNGKE